VEARDVYKALPEALRYGLGASGKRSRTMYWSLLTVKALDTFM